MVANSERSGRENAAPRRSDTDPERTADDDPAVVIPAARSHYWNCTLAGATVLLVALLLPYGKLTSQAYVGAGSEQVVRDFSITVWFWDLSLGAASLLLIAALLLLAAAVIGRRSPRAIGPVAAICLIALGANTYLASSLADRDWRDTPTPGALADTEPTPRCEFTGYGRSYPTLGGEQERLPLYSCVLGLDGPLTQLHDEVVAAGYAVPGMPVFRTGIGAHAYVVISFLLVVASGWVLLRRRLPRIAAGFVIALAVGLVYVVAIFDALGHMN
jgi:hypothetical protein